MGIAKTVNVRADLLGPNLAWQDQNNDIITPDPDLKWRILQGIELQGFQTGTPDPSEKTTVSFFPYGRGLYSQGELVQEFEKNMATGNYYRLIGLKELKGKGKGGRESACGKYSTPQALGWFDEEEDDKYVCLEKDMLQNFEYILQACPPKFMFANFPYEVPSKIVNNKKKWKRRIDL